MRPPLSLATLELPLGSRAEKLQRSILHGTGLGCKLLAGMHFLELKRYRHHLCCSVADFCTRRDQSFIAQASAEGIAASSLTWEQMLYVFCQMLCLTC